MTSKRWHVGQAETLNRFALSGAVARHSCSTQLLDDNLPAQRSDYPTARIPRVRDTETAPELFSRAVITLALDGANRGSPEAVCSSSDAAACAGPWPRSAGSARG